MDLSKKLVSIAENEQKVANVNMQLEQILYGTDTGGKSYYDEFWDNYQDKGNRTDYTNGFIGYGKGWNKDNFFPKYDIKPNRVGSIFYAWEDATLQSLDLIQRFKECNVEFDTSKATQVNQCFAYSKFTTVPAIDLTSVSGTVKSLYYSCPNLETIEKIKIHENIGIDGWFYNNGSLVNLIIEGTIGQNGFNVQWSTKLSQKSILSILKALSLRITETKTITFSTTHRTIIENDTECKPYWESAKQAGWSFVYA